jgi:hypothetical protein
MVMMEGEFVISLRRANRDGRQLTCSPLNALLM